MRFNSQRVAYWFFATCMLLLGLQIVYGFIMAFAHAGYDVLHTVIPFNEARASHNNLLLMWLLAGFMGKAAWWSVPAAVVIGVPMYSNAAGIIPVVEALLGKGAALGTVLAFMMAVIGLSLPEIVILRKVLRPRLIGAFVGVVASGILVVGWLFNAVL